MNQPDPINPPHYRRGDVECIDAIRSAVGDETDGFAAVLRANAIKYLWRLGHKGSRLENARKAYWYIHQLVNHEAQREQRAADHRGS